MKHRKAFARLQRRRDAYENVPADKRDGFTRPGSLKKPSAAGSRKH